MRLSRKATLLKKGVVYTWNKYQLSYEVDTRISYNLSYIYGGATIDITNDGKFHITDMTNYINNSMEAFYYPYTSGDSGEIFDEYEGNYAYEIFAFRSEDDIDAYALNIVKGNFIETVTSTNLSDYPMNGIKNGYYYELI